jgi:hypothetical protein
VLARRQGWKLMSVDRRISGSSIRIRIRSSSSSSSTTAAKLARGSCHPTEARTGLRITQEEGQLIEVQSWHATLRIA